MDLTHGDKVDSRCGVCQKESKIGPETMAVDWVSRTNGTRLYVCPEHARALGRFGRALEDLPETPAADLCNGCGQLTLDEDMAKPGLCKECAGESLDEAVLTSMGRDSLTFDEAMAVLDDLVAEDEEVTPEQAAEAVERWSGMPVTPAMDEDPADEEDEDEAEVTEE